MLKPYKIADYISEYNPQWVCTMPDGSPPFALYLVADNKFSNVELKHACLMRQLTLTATLEYYDVPQILTATDATGTRYLCTLYSQEADGYCYLGVQISEPRLMAFIGGHHPSARR